MIPIPVPLIGGPADGTVYVLDPYRVGLTFRVASARPTAGFRRLYVPPAASEDTATYVVHTLSVFGWRLRVGTPSDWSEDQRDAAAWAWLTGGRHDTLLADQNRARTPRKD